jgi:hypothetical protein
VASFDKAIPPGGVGKIVLTVKTEGFQGRITKTAYVKSNDPRKQTLNLSLSADIRTYIVVEPAPRAVLQGVVGDDLRQILQIRAGDGYPLQIRDTSTNMTQWLDYKIVSKGGNHQYDLELRGKAQTQASAGGYIRLVTNHPKKPEVTIPVQLRVRPELEVLPPEITFGRVSVPASGEKVVRVVTLVDNRGKSIRIRELKYNDKFFKATAVPLGGENASRWRIEVEPRFDRLPGGGVTDTVVVKLEGTKFDEVKVPVSITVHKEAQKSTTN